MSTLQEDLTKIKKVEDTLTSNKVAKFAYTDYAYSHNDANGVKIYNVSKEQNIPIDTPEVLNVNPTVLTKGYRAKASSITRMLMNHFLGRVSYNLNKVNDNLSSLLDSLCNYLGQPNGFASLDENGRIPYSQLPESAIEYKGQWNAQTNTPTLADGTGVKGDFYIVSVAGTQNLGSGNIQFFVNDRVIYDGSVWSRLSAGDVKTVNNIAPVNGNITLTKGDVGLGNVANTGDSAIPVSNGKTKFTTGGAFTELNKKQNKIIVNTSAHNPQDTDVVGAFAGITSASENPTLFVSWTFTKVWNWVKVKLGVSNGTTSTDVGSSTKPVYLNRTGKAVAVDDNSVLTNLASTTGANMYTSAPRPGVTGILPLDNGGTGSNTASGARTSLGLGSAAEKTAGSAAGNVPLVGTALGTTDNNIVVTNTSGQLKPSGTAIGSAAGKTAGSAAGNVPLVGTALGTTDNNLLVTDTSGQMKPFNKTPNQIVYWGNGGGVCNTEASKRIKTVDISGFALYTGVTIKVMFTNGDSSASSPKLDVNSTGEKWIKVIKAGKKFDPPRQYGKWRGADSETRESWQPRTILELMYDGTDWVIIGNPVVEDYYSKTQGYTVYANGLIEQWYKTSTISSKQFETVDFCVQFSSSITPNCTFGSLYDSAADSTVVVQLRSISNTQAQIKNATSSTVTNAFVCFRGY